MAKPKKPKIDPIPNAVELLAKSEFKGSFPPFPERVFGRTPCPVCEFGFVVRNDGPRSTYYFTCTDRGCDWDTRNPRPSNFTLPKVKAKPKKKVPKFQPDSPEVVDAIRAEIRRRTEILTLERAMLPPTLVKVGKGKKARWKINKKFTAKMAAHMHEFAFTHEQVREEVLKSCGAK